MSGQLEVLIAFLLYIAFFAWIGFRRGSTSEGIVFIFAVGGWFALQAVGDVLIRIVNIAGRGFALIRAGGLGAGAAAGAVGEVAPLIAAANRQTFLFLLWAGLLLFAYIISGSKGLGKKSKSDGLAIVLGILNGLFYAAVLLPRLVGIMRPTVNEVTGAVEPLEVTDLVRAVGGGVTLLGSSLTGLWNSIDPSQRSFVLLILLTLFLLLTAFSLRGNNSKPKKTT